MHPHYYLFWVCVAAYSIHLLEEFAFDWRGWANKTMGLAAGSPLFYFVSATVMILGFCCAMISAWLPVISLMFPALLIINAIFFHLLPAIIQRHFSPGLFSAILLLLPSGVLTYYGIALDGGMPAWVILASGFGAAVFAGFVLLLAKTEARFRYKA